MEFPLNKSFYLIKTSETLDLCDIWWVRKKHTQESFHQKYFSVLDYVFISNNLHESTVRAEVFEIFLSDYSLVAIIIYLSKELKWDSEPSKFNNPLLQDENFVKDFENYIKEFKTHDTDNTLDK